MDQLYKTALPAKAQQLVDQIEQTAGLPVQVIVDPTRYVSPTDPNPTRPELNLSDGQARIFLPTPYFEPNGIVHELLHIERYWLEKIPQVVPVDQNAERHWQITSSIENTLEHLVIVPREKAYGFDPHPYWAKTERVLWGRYPWPEITEPFARRKNALLGSLGVFNLAKDDGLTRFVQECLEKEGMLKEAVRFNKRITDVLHSKEKMLRLTIGFLQIPKTDVRLLYLDVETRRGRYTTV